MKLLAVFVLGATFLWQLLALPLYDLAWIDRSGGVLPSLEGVPDFLLLVLLYLALADRSRRVLCAATACGLVVDFISLDPWLTHTLGYLFATWLLRLHLLESWADFLLPRVVLLTLGVLTLLTTRLIVIWLGAEPYSSVSLAAFLFEAAYSITMGVILFPLLDALAPHLLHAPPKKLLQL